LSKPEPYTDCSVLEEEVEGEGGSGEGEGEVEGEGEWAFENYARFI